MKKIWKIVDRNGDDVMTADAVKRQASFERKTTKQIAEREAKLIVNVDGGDDPVFAIEVTD